MDGCGSAKLIPQSEIVGAAVPGVYTGGFEPAMRRSSRGHNAPLTFAAIDFETADSGRDSACQVGLVRVEAGRIVLRETRLIRPPRRWFEFTHIHGIEWRDVEAEPPFGPVWERLCPALDGVEFLAAHNASFDRAVLESCCERAGVAAPRTPFLCTMKLARRLWSIRPTRLPDVCSRLRLDLKHHDAGSDAEACAWIVLAASNEAGPSAVRELAGGARSTATGPARPRHSGPRPWPAARRGGNGG